MAAGSPPQPAAGSATVIVYFTLGAGGGIRDMFGDKYLPNFVKIQASGDANNSQNSFIVIGY